MADQIKAQCSTDVELIPSSGGAFEVVVDKELIYSKKETGEYPSERQILDQLAAR